MSPRRQAQSLLSLSLESVELLVTQIIKIISPVIVKYHNDRSKWDLEQRLASQNVHRMKDKKIAEEHKQENEVDESENGNEDKSTLIDKPNYDEADEAPFEEYSSDKNYRKQVTMDYVERLRDHIFSHIPYSLTEDVKSKVSIKLSHDSFILSSLYVRPIQSRYQTIEVSHFRYLKPFTKQQE